MLALHRARHCGNQGQHDALGGSQEPVRIALLSCKFCKKEINDWLRASDALLELFRVFADKVCGILTLREPCCLHADPCVERECRRARGRREPCWVGIQDKHQVLAVALHQREMPLGERRTRERHGVLEARLMREDYIHLSLHEHREFAYPYRVFGEVHTEENLGFMIKLGLGRIEILRGVVFRERAAGEGDDPTGAIAYREHQTVAKSVIVSTRLPVCFFNQSCAKHLFNREPFGSQCLEERAPCLRSEANAPRLYSVRHKTALLRVCLCGTSFEIARVPLARTAHQRAQSLLLRRIFLSTTTIYGSDLDTSFFRKDFQRALEVHSLNLLNKREPVAALSAAEAVPAPALQTYME